MRADSAQTNTQTTGRSNWLRPRRSLTALAVIVVALGLRPVAAQTCVGDCNADGMVTINELITGVYITLGSLPVSDCQAFENAQGKVDIAQVIQGVNNALNGCPGTPNRFVDNGDGTITDKQTRLIWEKQDRDGGFHDLNATYVWFGSCSDGTGYCQPDPAAATTCNAATNGTTLGCAQCMTGAPCNTDSRATIWDWLAQLNAMGFAGHSDWRIPTVSEGGTPELETILSAVSCGAPCVPPAFNTGCVAECTVASCSCTAAAPYWSATDSADNAGLAWVVSFYDGVAYKQPKWNFAHVRAVRGGS